MAKIRRINKHDDNISNTFEKPTEHVQSEGEILIKKLFKKQTNTEIHLCEQLVKKKEFDSPQQLTQLVNFKSGETSLQQFKTCSERLIQIEDLKYYGLTAHEIELYLDSQRGEEYLQMKHKNISKSVLEVQLKEISDKIEKKKLESEDIPEKHVSRHFKDLGLSVKPDSEETKLFNFALACAAKKEDNVALNHPINGLKDIENELFSHLARDDVPSLAKRRKRMKKLEESEIYFKNTLGANTEKKSKWDLKEPEIEIVKPANLKNNVANTLNISHFSKRHDILPNEEKIYSCERPNFYTIKDGQILKLNTNRCDIDEKSSFVDIKRLTEHEIRLIPKFKNYEKGVPSKVLYVKNIARTAKDEFLTLFGNSYSNNDKPTVKVMTGKMQGQAFVTFKTEDLATDALNRYNGIVLKEKPLIISYGKSQ